VALLVLRLFVAGVALTELPVTRLVKPGGTVVSAG
jgi:hypothetical protein